MVVLSEKTLWIGNIEPDWTTDFLFKQLQKAGLQVSEVHIASRPSAAANNEKLYGFANLVSEEEAYKAMTEVYGTRVPDADKCRFVFNYAHHPNESPFLHGITVTGLDEKVREADLFQKFARKYRSVRIAKITPAFVGYVKFACEKEHRRALRDMQAMTVCGRRMRLRTTGTESVNERRKGAGGQQAQGQGHSNAFVNPMMMPGHIPLVQPPVREGDEPIPHDYENVDAMNDIYINRDWYEDVESSRWSTTVWRLDVTERHLVRILNDAAKGLTF